MYAHIETIDGAKYLVFDVFFNNDAQSMVKFSKRQWYIWQVPYQIAKLNPNGLFENDTIRDLRFDAYKLKKAENHKEQRKMNFTLSRDFAKFEKVDNQSTTINFPNDSEKNFGVKNPSRFQYSLGPNLTSDSQYEANMKSLFHENYQDYAIGKATYPDYPYSSKNYGIGIQTTEVNLAFHMHAAVKLNDKAINEKATTYDEKYANIHNAWTWADSATYGRTTSSSYAWVSGRDPQSENDQKLQRHKDDKEAPKIYYNGTEVTDNQTIKLYQNDKLSFTTTDNKGYIEKFSISGLTKNPTVTQGDGSEKKPLPSGDIKVTKKMNGKEVTITSEDGSGNVTTRKVKVTVTTLADEHPITGKTIDVTVGDQLPKLTKLVEIKDGNKLEKQPDLRWNGPAPKTDTVGVFTYEKKIKGEYSDKSKSFANVTINVKPKKPVIDTDLTDLAGKKGQKVTVSVGSGIPTGAKVTTTVKLFDKNGNEIGSTTTINNGKADITVKDGIPAGDVYATTTVKKLEEKTSKTTTPGFEITSEESDKKQATKPKDAQDPTITVAADSSSVTVGQDLKIHIVATDDVKVEEVDTLQALMKANLLQSDDIVGGRASVSPKTTNTDQEQVLDLTVKNMKPKEVGTYKLTFTVTDSAGKTGSTTLTITVKPTVNNPKAENKTGKDKTTVSGKTTPGATVTISKNGKEVGKVTAGTDGSFTVDIDKQDPNTTLTLTPSKGDVTGDPVTTTVTGETPAAPKVEPQNDGSVDVTPAAGTDTLEITYTPEGEANEKTITVKKGNDGNWTGENIPTGVTVDKTTGKVTIPADKVKDNSDVTAQNSKNGTKSEKATGNAGNNGGNSGSGSETGNSNSSESDSGNDSTSNNAGNAETGNAGNGKAGNVSTGASGSNESTKSGNDAPAKHSSQLVKTGAEVERVGLISAMIGVLGAAAAFFSRKKNRE